jgi:hypothetical protein
MVIPLEYREAVWTLSPAKRRWLQAIGYAISLVRMNKRNVSLQKPDARQT